MFVCVIDVTLSHQITSASSNDPLVLQALQFKNEDISPAFCSHLSDWQITEDVLTYKSHIYIPNDDNLCCTILLCHHDHETAGHPGFLKICQLVTAEFWWSSLASYVRKYVEGCATCQQNKVNTHSIQQIFYDLIMDLPPFLSFNSFLVMVDHGFTKGVILCPTKKSITTKGITSLFFHKVFLCFGLFDKVISDCGPQFTSTFT